MEPAQLHNVEALLQQHLEALEQAMGSGRLLEQTLRSSSSQSPFSTKLGPPALKGRLQSDTLIDSDTCVCVGSETHPFHNFPNKSVIGSGLSLSARLRLGKTLAPKAESPRSPRATSTSTSSNHEKTATSPRVGFSSSVEEFSHPAAPEQRQLVEPLLAASSSTEEIGSHAKKTPSRHRPGGQTRRFSSAFVMLKHSHTLMESEIETARSKEEIEQLWKKKEILSIVEKEAKVEKDKYQSEGLGQKIRLSHSFNIVCFIAILANALWVGVQIDLYKTVEESSWISRGIDNAFLAWFAFELVVWFFAFKRTRDALTYWWFVLSAVIVGLMMWTLWVAPLLDYQIKWLDYQHSSFLQVLRLTRIARLSRIFAKGQNSPEILFHATGILQGIKATAPLLCLFGLIVYIFAIAFRWLQADMAAFETVPKAFHFLFWAAMGNPDKNMLSAMLAAGWGPWVLFVAYTLIGNLTVAKMLTGLLLQVVMKLIQKEKEISDTVALEHTIERVAEKLDTDTDGSVSIAEFEQLMLDRELLQSMADHDVDVASFLDFTRAYFPADGHLFLEDLVRNAKQFCGFKPASVKDMMNLRKLMYVEVEVITKGQAQILEEVRAVTRMSSTSPRVGGSLEQGEHSSVWKNSSQFSVL